MFERMRSDLVRRLSSLMDRYEAISRRAQEALKFADTATRLGLGANDQLALTVIEVASKSVEQAGLCGQAATQLTVGLAFPPIYKRSVTKAETFADQCEQILSQFEGGQMEGRRAFERKFGKPNEFAED